ncbi:MAG: glycosyltransferase family 4 protein [Lachnospiraceae bacterium]|nr:glycosyltransferase family 4 protein [Lachnospiraceae bacterium]
MALHRQSEIISGLQSLFGNVFLPEAETGVQDGEKQVAVFLHSLHTGGSQTAMLEMTRLLKECGIRPLICAVHDGAVKDTFLREGIPCCICGQPENREEVRAFFLEHFDAVWLNTVSAYYFSYFFLNTKMPLIWWFHETKEVLSAFDGYFPNPMGLSENIRFAATTKKMQQSLRELYEKDAVLLPLPLQDMRDTFAPAPERGKVRFLFPATYKAIKGHDLFLKAVSLLPANLRVQAEYICCGHTYPEDVSYREQLDGIAARMEDVTLTDALTRDALYQQYADCDCVLAPSRLDSGPLTVMEAEMFEKLTIVSDAAGIASMLTDCVNGFVFPSGNAEELMKRMALVIADHASLGAVAAAGRKTYEEHFTPEAVREYLKTVLRESGI